eukprot:CAMPEP_0205822852 /NCGR_PEP_ID=MMETSP0206-20130828/14300_1 /ASSEMBLY_ACC=CAM_ASM_000279 /TAXON_ID=36767 /ORGANISM="Euplotes focardii, Strain TN1" /LENGTH=373 /DNA_ID=CAMNT_0053119477 /DNA_START=1 /DNA_END=1125 /DNA_ORIENTATION=+
MESGLDSKAIICETADKNEFTVKTIQVKAPAAGFVRVQMKYATFSKHDGMQHAHDSNAEYPYLAGYDGVGIVEQVGEGIEEFEIGDYVSIFLVPGNPSLTGKSNLSDHAIKILGKGKFWRLPAHLEAYDDDKNLAGFQGVGTWSQYAVFHAGHLLKLDGEPSLKDACLGSALGTGLLGPSKILNIDEEGSVAIFGSNSLGLTLVSSVKKTNPKLIVVVGAKEDQELFEKLGATFVVDEGEPSDIHKSLMEISGDGYDFTFEASNFSRFGTVALEICHKGWGKCALLTKASEDDATISTRPFQLVTGRHWIGSFMGNINIARDHEALLSAHKELSESIAEYIVPEDHVVSIDDFPQKWKELSETATYHRTIIQF